MTLANALTVYDATPVITSIQQSPPTTLGGPFYVTISGRNFGPYVGVVAPCAHASGSPAPPCGNTPTSDITVAQFSGQGNGLPQAAWSDTQVTVLVTPSSNASGLYDLVVASRGVYYSGISNTFLAQGGPNSQAESNRKSTNLDFGSINTWVVNKDNPYNTVEEIGPTPTVVYGGSQDSTSDRLRLTLSGPIPNASTYAWSVTGTGASAYTPPPVSTTPQPWVVGRILPQAGVLTFTMTVTGGGNSLNISRAVEVGIRSDDVIIIGWIDRDNVPDTKYLTGGVSPEILQVFPPDGKVSDSNACANTILNLSTNCTTYAGLLLKPEERRYVLDWMFRFANNPDPSSVIPGKEFSDGTAADRSKVQNYLADGTNYKVYNRFQVKWRVGLTPVALGPKTATVGATVDPCHFIVAPPPPQTGPNNQSSIATPAQISMVNDGSPDPIAVRAFDTLMGKDVDSPVFWENIGSRITFTPNGAFEGLHVMQPYPSYNIYVNGKYTGTRVQTADPIEQFVPNPYPFGTVACPNQICGITPGGRCGDASSPADGTARTPLFIVQQ